MCIRDRYNYFHMEQRPRFKPDPFKAENFYYNEEHDFCICPMGNPDGNVGQTCHQAFNTSVARIMELVNAMYKYIDGQPDGVFLKDVAKKLCILRILCPIGQMQKSCSSL